MNQTLPKWLVVTLGALLVIFVAILIVQKGTDLNDKIKNRKPAQTMAVSADGKVQATPDLATVTIGVMSQGTTAKDVKDQNNTKVNKVIEFIKQQGIDAKDIKTSQYNFYPQQDWSNGTARIIGYQGNQTVTVKVHDIDKGQTKLEAILDGSVNNGANEIQNVSFSFNDPDNLKQQARKQAIANAKTKAQELASEAGLTLGKIVSVSESNTSFPGPVPYAMDYAAGRGGAAMNEAKSIAPDIQPGSQDITETMSVIFEVK